MEAEAAALSMRGAFRCVGAVLEKERGHRRRSKPACALAASCTSVQGGLLGDASGGEVVRVVLMVVVMVLLR